MPTDLESIRQFKHLLSSRYLSWHRPRLKTLLVVLLSIAAALPLVFFLRLPAVPVFAGAVVAASVCSFLTHIFDDRSPSAMVEARLQALSARIRPHFLFNSLNAVIGTIRVNPRLAESSLEELADLFRALLQDPRTLVPLSDELALCRKYLALERLRLGERLQVSWDIDRCPPDALMPPLMLQPLLENAVYHGIEPRAEAGTIAIRFISAGSVIAIELSNPCSPDSRHVEGNRMALANIKERLDLFYNGSAMLDSTVSDGRYTVRLVFPYQHITSHS